MKKIIKILAVALALGLSAPARAEFNLIVPFAAGGAVDIVARKFQRWAQEQRSQTIIIENVPGAGGYLGLQRLLLAGANTVALSSNSLFVNSIEHDFPLDRFRYITVLAEAPFFLIVREDSKLDCASLRQNSRKLFIGSGGTNSITSAAAQISMAQLPGLTEVQYRGTSQALVDLVGGRIDAMYIATLDRNPRITYLAITGSQSRYDLPTVKQCLGHDHPLTQNFIFISNHRVNPQLPQRILDLAQEFSRDPQNTAWAELQGLKLFQPSDHDMGKYINERAELWRRLTVKQ